MTRKLLLILPFILAACVHKQTPPTGEQDFASFCTACHGSTGTGNGAAASALAQKPADLTRLTARNGGSFPGTAVMGKIWGYTGGKDSHAVMPEFAALLDSDLVPYDGGDGIASPTPLRLVQIAEHLKTLQN